MSPQKVQRMCAGEREFAPLPSLTNKQITDKDDEVRRGCIYVFNLLLRGMGKDIFELVPGMVGCAQALDLLQAPPAIGGNNK